MTVGNLWMLFCVWISLGTLGLVYSSEKTNITPQDRTEKDLVDVRELDGRELLGSQKSAGTSKIPQQHAEDRKRSFDSIAYKHSLGGFKRKFDPINYRSDFGGFKRSNTFMPNAASVSFLKRFDPISYQNDFGGFRKRSVLTHLRKRRSLPSHVEKAKRKNLLEQMIRFVDVGRMSPLDQEHFYDLSKRPFDSIQEGTDFGGFKKRSFDSISADSTFGGLSKRPFDSISDKSVFGGLSKRSNKNRYVESLANRIESLMSELGIDSLMAERGRQYGRLEKRPFDSISDNTEFGHLSKKSFDSIDNASDFGGFKRSFDSISGGSVFGGLQRRSFDSIDGSSDFGKLSKRSFDSIHGKSDFGGLKRSFDSIEHVGEFGNLG